MSMPEEIPEFIHSSFLETLTGLGEKRFRQLSAEGILPPFNRAMWPTVDTLRRLFQYYKKRSDESDGAAEIEKKLNLERLRKLRLQNSKAAREVIAVEDAQKAIGDVLLTFVSLTDDFADKLAAQLENKSADFVRARLKQEIRELRETLATPPDFRYLDEAALEEEEAEEDENTQEPTPAA